IPRNEGIFKSKGGTLPIIMCFIYMSTYFQIFLILSYHFVYRLNVLVRGISVFEDWTLAHWVVLGAVVYVLYISAFLWCGWYAFMGSDYSRMVAPSFFIDLYNVNASDPDIGFFHITWKRENLQSGLMEWHYPTVIAMITCAVLYMGTGTVIVGCIVKITKSLKAADLSEKTRKMQQELFRALLIQVTSPTNLSQLQFSILNRNNFVGIDLGAIGNPIFMTTTIFPSIDALFIIFLIPRFRASFFRAFRMPFHKSS
ncbi:hypothetical protein PFISCL1PPCAC_11814, partial [Pristionchus fissidentatus]